MKILYIIPTFQHPKVRGSDRHYHFVRELAQRHRITLLSLQRVDQIAPEALQEISAWVDELITFKVERSAATGVTQLLTKVPVVGKTVAEQKAVRDSVEQMRRTFRRLAREG
ncbi:MAG: hypothetical protein KDE47_34230, partial [Caldilineaceae bacterium]|nr:hypothetical protein [Caldilineaceae bacterium]